MLSDKYRSICQIFTLFTVSIRVSGFLYKGIDIYKLLYYCKRLKDGKNETELGK